MKTFTACPRLDHLRLATLLVAFVTLIACGQPAPTVDLATDGESIDLASFELTNMQGEATGLAAYSGEIVVLDFWATWCGPCRIQAEELEEIYPEYRERGVQFLAVDSGEDLETVERFVEKNPFSYPVLLDTGDKLAMALEVMALPTVVIVDRDGNVVFNQAGIATAEELGERLEKVL